MLNKNIFTLLIFMFVIGVVFPMTNTKNLCEEYEKYEYDLSDYLPNVNGLAEVYLSKEDLNKTFDYEEGEVKLPVIDKELAAKLAQAKLDEYGAQYSIDIDNFTIISVERNGETELLRVTPLEYENVFVSMSRMHQGTIGYIEVNVVTQVAKLVKFDENDGLKYMPSGIFKYDDLNHI